MTQKAGMLAVVTGATAGIGRAFAERLARDGYDLLLVARDPERLRQTSEDLSSAHGVEASSHVGDLADPAALRVLESILRERVPDILVNNAGFGIPGGASFEQIDPDEIERMIQVHCVALSRLTRAVLPGMVERGTGDVINLSSLSSFMIPRVPVYSGTKAYVTAFTIGLLPLVQGTQVRLQALCPGWTITEFHQRMGMDRYQDLGVPREWWMTAEDLVEASLAGLQRREVVCVPGLEDDALVEGWLTAARLVADTAQRSAAPASRYGLRATRVR